eukprot:866225-Pleurochrysis_carterae.AAC.2
MSCSSKSGELACPCATAPRNRLKLRRGCLPFKTRQASPVSAGPAIDCPAGDCTGARSSGCAAAGATSGSIGARPTMYGSICSPACVSRPPAVSPAFGDSAEVSTGEMAALAGSADFPRSVHAWSMATSTPPAQWLANSARSVGWCDSARAAPTPPSR